MIFKPLVSLVSSKDVKSLSVIEGLVLTPLAAFLMHYLLGLTELELTIRSAITGFVGVLLAGGYARFATS